MADNRPEAEKQAKRRAGVVTCQSLQMHLAYVEQVLGLDCSRLLARFGWSREFVANTNNIYSFDTMLAWFRELAAFVGQPAPELFLQIGISGFGNRRLNFMESVSSRLVVDSRMILSDLGYWAHYFNRGYHKLRAFLDGPQHAIVVANYDPVFTAENSVVECFWTRGLLMGFPVNYGSERNEAQEVLCSFELADLVRREYADQRLTYEERGADVLIDGRKVAERVILEQEELAKPLRRATLPYEEGESWEPFDALAVEPQGRRLRLALKAQTPRGGAAISDWGQFAGLSEAERRERNVAIRMTEDISVNGRLLFPRGMIYNARHCRYDVRWARNPSFLRRARRLVRSALCWVGWWLAGETPWSLERAQQQLRDSEEMRNELQKLTRELEDRVTEEVAKGLGAAQRLGAAEAQVRTGKAYAASAAHDINNALGPARSGIEDMLGILRAARPLPHEAESATEANEADFARQLGLVFEEKLTGLVDTFENVAHDLTADERVRLLDSFEYLLGLARAAQRAIPDIYRGINRASDYTAHMNEVARIDYREARSPVRLDALLAALASRTRGPWESRGIRLTTRIEGPLTVMGWPRILESIFSNLLDNAAEAMALSERKELHLAAGRDGARCLARVTDTGPGVPEDLREKIFELGFTTHPAKGKGFGLAHVRNFVLLLGGDIKVEGAPEGGASFVLNFPLVGEGEPT